MAVAYTWPNGAKSASFNRIMQKVFFTTMKFNILLHSTFVASRYSPFDCPSRNLSLLDSMLHADVGKLCRGNLVDPRVTHVI